MGHIYGLEEDFEGASCVLQLNLSRTLRNIIINGTHCPMTFQWRGIHLGLYFYVDLTTYLERVID